MLKLSSNVSDVFPEVLKLSCEVGECRPQPPSPSPSAVIMADISVFLYMDASSFLSTFRILPRCRGLHSFTFQLNLSRV